MPYLTLVDLLNATVSTRSLSLPVLTLSAVETRYRFCFGLESVVALARRPVRVSEIDLQSAAKAVPVVSLVGRLGHAFEVILLLPQWTGQIPNLFTLAPETETIEANATSFRRLLLAQVQKSSGSISGPDLQCRINANACLLKVYLNRRSHDMCQMTIGMSTHHDFYFVA